MISMVTSGCIAHYRRTYDGINILKGTVSATILIKSVGFVNCLTIRSSHLLGESSSNTAVQNIVTKIGR